MKIVQSFWSGGNGSLDKGYGWMQPKYHWLSWVLSVNQLRKFYDDVELVTDEFGYHILIEKLKLPYTKVRVELDELNTYPSNLWALAKIKAYGLQETPFLHVDGDVFIWKTFPDELMRSDLIVQNTEVTSGYYGGMWERIRPLLSYLPEGMEAYDQGKSKLAYNMGIFGGNDIPFIKVYTKQAMSFVDRNMTDEMWEQRELFNFNIFFEQVLLHRLAEEQSVQVSSLIHEDIGDNMYTGFGDFHKVPYERDYLHLIGLFKSDLVTCKRMEAYVFKYYPEHYQRLLQLMDSTDLLSNTGYSNSFAENKALMEEYERILTHGEKGAPMFRERRLMGRDLFMEGQVLQFTKMRETGERFRIVPITDLRIEEERDEQGETKAKVVIDELDGQEVEVELMLLDQIIFDELGHGGDSVAFAENAPNYLSDDFPEEEKEDFLETLWKRIAHLISIKVFVAMPYEDNIEGLIFKDFSKKTSLAKG